MVNAVEEKTAQMINDMAEESVMRSKMAEEQAILNKEIEKQTTNKISQIEDTELNKRKKEALVDCFVRTYHLKRFSTRVFTDFFAHRLISDEEYSNISKEITENIYKYKPDFDGTDNEALDWMVEKKYAPAILGRNCYCENKLIEFAQNWGQQYIVFDAAYDTFGHRNFISKLKVYEIDQKEMIEEKKRRLLDGRVRKEKSKLVPYDSQNKNWKEAILQTDYDQEKKTFCNLMGISYRISKDNFADLITQISNIVCERSQIVFDFSMDTRQENWYTYEEIYYLLEEKGFELIECLDNVTINEKYFKIFNSINSQHMMFPPNNCNYCLAIKRKK